MSKQLTDAKRKAIRKYDAANTKQVHLKLNINTDADILAHLGVTDKVQGYIKKLIRDDMKVNPKKYPPTRYSDELYGCPICKAEVTPGEESCPACHVSLEWEKA